MNPSRKTHTTPTNILLICCDQLSAGALRAWGNGYARTPNIDRLAGQSHGFRRAYTNYPLCMPSRASFWSGLYPHQTGVMANGSHPATPDVPANPRFPIPRVPDDVSTLGSLFREAGYTTAHFGKGHDAGALRGFDLAPVRQAEVESGGDHAYFHYNYDSREDRNTRVQGVEFLNRHPADAPYLAVMDFNNPHNICGWIGENQNLKPLQKIFDDLPPLPANLYLDDAELARRPLPIRYLPHVAGRQAQIAQWDELKIRHYLHAYHHYLSRVDDEVGRVLEALRARPDAGNTLVVFFSDHGDSMCGRWMATKGTSFYEETMHVPLLFSGPGIDPAAPWSDALCSLVDLLPTLCDYAGIATPERAAGRSLLPWLRSKTPPPAAPEAVFAEWHTEFGHTIDPGRMVRTDRYKYTCYREENGEELYDLVEDPGEMRNLAADAGHAAVLEHHRSLLRDFCGRQGDPFFRLQPEIEPRFREGVPTYRNFSTAPIFTPPHAQTLPETPFDAPAGTWTLVVLPDTQYYTQRYPEVFLRQMEWIVANREKRDIRFVLHEGDMTNNNAPDQWENGRRALDILNKAGIPWLLVAGNHDMGTQGGGQTNDRSTRLNDYFTARDYAGPEAVGFFEEGRMENSWREFSSPAGKFLVVGLEFGPRDEVLDWADRVVAEHPGDQVIVLTHSYLNHDSTLLESPRDYPFAKKGSVNGARGMWDKFVSRHPGIRFVLSGHVVQNGTGHLASRGAGGRTVHQILANYQGQPDVLHGGGTVEPHRGWGGGGYLRLMEFAPDGKTVAVKTYSPWYDKWLLDAAQDFTVKID